MTDQFQLAFDTWTSENPKIQFYTGGGSPVLNASNLQWQFENWYNVTLTREGNLFKLYRSGVEIYSSTSSKFNQAGEKDSYILIKPVSQFSSSKIPS